MDPMTENLQKISESIEKLVNTGFDSPEFRVPEYTLNGAEQNFYDLYTKDNFEYLETPADTIQTLTLAMELDAPDSGSFAWKVMDEWRTSHGNEDMPGLIHYCTYCFAEEQMALCKNIYNESPEEVKQAIQSEIDKFPEYISSCDTADSLYHVIDTAAKIEELIDKNFPDIQKYDYLPEASDTSFNRCLGFEVEVNSFNEAIVRVSYANQDDAMMAKDDVTVLSKEVFLNNPETFAEKFSEAWNTYTHNLNCLNVGPERACAEENAPSLGM